MTAPSGVCRLAPVRGGNVDWAAGQDVEMRPISVRQTAILRYIADHVADRGYPPSFRQIVTAVGLRSTGSLRYQIRELAGKGLLEQATQPGQARSLRLVQPGEVG